MAHRTVTVRASAGDYTSLQGAITGEVAANANITGLSTDTDAILGVPVALEIRCYAVDDVAAVYVNGFTTDATHWLLITVPSSDRHAGAWDDTKYNLVYSSAAYGAFTADVPYCICDGLQIHNPSTGTGLKGSGIVLNTLVRSGGNCVVLNGSSTLNNCIFDGGTTYNEQVVSGTVTFENCDFVNSTSYGYVNNGGTCVMKNCYAGNNTELDYLGTISFTTCACADDITASGLTKSIPYSTATFDSVTFGATGYLKPASAGALTDAGTDLSADAAWYLDATDIGGRSRGTWDIGAVENAASSQVALPSSDISAGTWSKSVLPVGIDLYSKIADTDDTTYIHSAVGPSNDTCVVGLSAINTPSAGTVTIRVRASTY